MKSRIKTQVRAALTGRDREGLLSLLDAATGVVSALGRLLYDEEELIRWRAAEALGWVAAHDPYRLEKYVGRILYTMNDDSGSIGWFAPQAMAEILMGDADLAEDVFPIVLGNINRAVFRFGVLWALGRVAPSHAWLTEEYQEEAAACLGVPEAGSRGLAAYALGRMGAGRYVSEIARIAADREEFLFYEAGRLGKVSVAEMARRALDLLKA